MALSERRFDARIAALEAVTRLAKEDDDRVILLSAAEQLEDWLLRDGPVAEEEPRLIGWVDEARQASPWDRIRFGRGA